jgi:hypothetical protein
MDRMLAVMVTGSVLAVGAAGAGPAVPEIAGEWWQVAFSPELPEIESPPGEVVDHCFFPAADGTWQLWTQIRDTRHGRLFFRWVGSRNFVNGRELWQPDGICWVGDPHAGEAPRVIQAPFCAVDGHRRFLFYGGGGCICRADSADGLVFIRHRGPDGRSALFGDLSERGSNGIRDPFLLRTGDRCHLYYTRGTEVLVRSASSPAAAEWSAPATAKRAPGGPQSPTVVRFGDWFYLFTMAASTAYRTEVYASRNPLDFDSPPASRVALLSTSASEVIRVGDRWFISSLIPVRNAAGAITGHGGVRVAPLAWRPAGQRHETDGER